MNLLAVLIAAAHALPTVTAVQDGVRSSSWISEDSVVSRERFPVAFRNQRRIAYLRTYEGMVRVEVTLLGRRAGRLDSLGLEIAFVRPISTSIRPHLLRLSDLLTRLHLPVEARTMGLEIVAGLDAVPDPARPLPREAVVPMRRSSGALVIDSRGSFNNGGGNRYGEVLLQFTPVSAPELKWPTVQDVEALFPVDRRVMLSGNSDVPAILPPAITAMACRRVRLGYRCRYQTTVADWIGSDAPQGRYEDEFRQGTNNSWFLHAN